MSNGITIQVTEQVYDLQLITDKITLLEIFDFSVAGDVIPASLFTGGPGNMLVSAGASDPRQLDNVTTPPGDGYVLTWDSTQPLKMKFKANGVSGGAIVLNNKSGVQCNPGDVVILDKTNPSAFTTTTVPGDRRALGVVKEVIPANGSGMVAIGGSIEIVNVSGNVAIGQALITCIWTKYAGANGNSKQAGMIGYALTAYNGGGAGTVYAFICPDLSSSGASVVVEGSTYINGQNTGGSLVCGVNPNRIVLAFVIASASSALSFTAPQVAGMNMPAIGSEQHWTDTGITDAAIKVYALAGNGTGTLGITSGAISNMLSFQTVFIALSGVAASSPLGAPIGTTLTGTAPSSTTSDALPGDAVFAFTASAKNPAYGETVTARGAGQTTVSGPVNTGYANGIELDVKTATSVAETLSFTLSASAKHGTIVVPVRPM